MRVTWNSLGKVGEKGEREVRRRDCKWRRGSRGGNRKKT